MAAPTFGDSQAQSPPILKVFADIGKHPPVALDRPVCVIGRDYDANLPLDAPEVSRHHALIVRDQAAIYLRDLASKNGVQRNGRAVSEIVLVEDDTLRVGAFTLRCATGFPARPASDLEESFTLDEDEEADRAATGEGLTLEDLPSAPADTPEQHRAPPADLRVGERT